jgi:peroxiredoxin
MLVVVIFAVVVSALIALAIGGWLIAQLVAQNEEIDGRLTDLEYPERARARASSEEVYAARLAAGHRPSTVLNDFELPNLAGGTTTLSRWRGQRIALIFVHPDCPFSRQILPLIARRSSPVSSGERVPVIVSSGDPERNRALLGEPTDGVQVALQEEAEVARLLRVGFTPAAYLVDATGVTEGPLLIGAGAILAALGIGVSIDDALSRGTQDTTPLPSGRPDRPVPLTRGQVAPLLDMATLDDSRIVLGERLERRTALVFVEPDCPACRDLAPRLLSWSQSRSDDLSLIVVSAADAAATEAFVDEFALPFPVVPNRSRTVASGFGTLEWPSAVLLDEVRRLEAPIAVGADAIIDLLSDGVSIDPSKPRRAVRDKSSGGEPLVSVILTTRDRPNFLRFALTCYQQQTYENRELIVVDDGDRFPVDPSLVEAAGGRLVRAPLGTPIGAKLNLGLEAAEGSLCQKMDDDDWYAPAYIETMVEKLRESWRDACRPAVAFVTPFLFFDVARWEIRRSLDRNVPGATLFFRRSDWVLHRFRALPGDEDLWFFLDQVRAGATPVVIEQPELFLAVRHRGSRSEREHTWINQSDNRPLEDYLLERPLHSRTPDRMLPPWALMFYQDLRAEILAAREEIELAADTAVP